MAEYKFGISVIVPVYNAEEYLGTCLDSILSQTFQDFEVICVDDGSTDSSSDILKRYTQRDGRVRGYRVRRGNAGNARNYGMDRASGKYLLFLDADDCFAPAFFERMYGTAEDRELDITVCGAKRYDMSTRKTARYGTALTKRFLPAQSVFSSRDIPEHLFNFAGPYVWNKLFRRQFIVDRKIRFQDLKKTNDLYFTQAALSEAERIAAVDEELIFYRTNNKKSLQGNRRGGNQEFIEAHYAVKSYLESRGKWGLFRVSYLNQCVSSCLYNLSNTGDYADFSALYRRLRGEVFHETGICGMSEKEYQDVCNCHEIAEIYRYSCEEYLYRRSQRCAGLVRLEYSSCEHIFPFEQTEYRSRVVLYGAGDWGRRIYRQIINTDYVELAAWADADFKQYQTKNREICAPEEIKNLEFDCIFVAIKDRSAAAGVASMLLGWGISRNKIMIGGHLIGQE